MKEKLTSFLESKLLSDNTRLAYQTDIRQFLEVVDGKVNVDKLLLYQNFLADLKPSVQKRKASAVNQFLYFLYQKGTLSNFYKVRLTQPTVEEVHFPQLLDLSRFFGDYQEKQGQLIALMILHLGLTPSELRLVERAEMSLDFKVLRLTKSGVKRLLDLPDALLPYLEDFRVNGGRYLFDHDSMPYSRQWFFNQLASFLKESGYPELTAQKLREQYILRQVTEGANLYDLAKNLGLKSVVTLEKYTNDIKYGYKN